MLAAHRALSAAIGPGVGVSSFEGTVFAVRDILCEALGATQAWVFVVPAPGQLPVRLCPADIAPSRSVTRAVITSCADTRVVQTPARGGITKSGIGTRHDGPVVVVPLRGVRNQANGALALQRGADGPEWDEGEIAHLEVIGAHLATRIENDQLSEQLVRSLDEVLTLYGAGEAISSSLDLDRVLTGILEISQRLTRADACYITDTGGSVPVVLASRGETGFWDGVRQEASVATVLSQVRADGEGRATLSDGVRGWCVGLKVRGYVIGTLEVYAHLASELGDKPNVMAETQLLSGLATQAAIALENAKLYQAVREKETNLQQLVERMIRAQEEDRRRVAYDIHDGLAQLMVSAHQHLQTFGIYHQQKDARAEPSLLKGLFMLQKSIEEVRKVIAGLRPSELDDFGLMAALTLLVSELRDDLGWRVEFTDGIEGARLPASLEVSAYRIVQEALNNARRHGEATRARISVTRSGGDIELVIRDWGRGFDVDALTARIGGSVTGHHVGVHGMRERAHLLGGSFTIESEPGDGTTVTVVIPLDRQVDPIVVGIGEGFTNAGWVGETPGSAGGAVVTGTLAAERGTGGLVVATGAVSWPGARRNAGGSIGNWVPVREASDTVIEEDDTSNVSEVSTERKMGPAGLPIT